MGQQQLQFDTDKKSIRDAVRDLMVDGQWRSSFEIQRLLRIAGKPATDSTITSKARELRLPRYGGYILNCEQHDGVWEYQLLPK
jgi:hypothetical protein